jgi:hypothetical protein
VHLAADASALIAWQETARREGMPLKILSVKTPEGLPGAETTPTRPAR